MEEAIISAPWTEIAMRRLWALLEVQTFTSSPCPLTREEACQYVLPSLEVYPDTDISVPAMKSIVNRQVLAASRARNAVRSLTKKGSISNTEKSQVAQRYARAQTVTAAKLNKSRRRTFPISTVFHDTHEYCAPVNIVQAVTSALDFLYLGKMNSIQRERLVPTLTLRAAKSIMLRHNDLQRQNGLTFMQDLASVLTPNDHSLQADGTDSSVDEGEAQKFAALLKQQGLVRGDYRLLQAARLDLPAHVPPPHATHWLELLLEPAKSILTANCVPHLRSSVAELRAQGVLIPRARVHSIPCEYPKTLERLHLSGMITLSLVNSEEVQYSQLADDLTLTSFSVVKEDSKDRLISWPRVLNSQFPEPPRTYLPNPGHFSHLNAVPSCTLSGFYLDVENMFHNIRLPPHLSSLFPLQKIAYGNQNTDGRQHLHITGKGISTSTLWRPTSGYWQLNGPFRAA